MKDIYFKCIELFSRKKARVLIITTQNSNSKKTAYIQDTSIMLISDKHEQNIISLLDISTKNEPNKNALYDLIILDQICDSPILQTELTPIWRTRQEMFLTLEKNITPEGSLIILAKNSANFRKPSHLFVAAMNLFIQTERTGSFYSQYSREINRARFSKNDHFYVFPSFVIPLNLVSTSRVAYTEFMLRSHGLSPDIPKQPRHWLRWLSVWFGLDRWFISSQLFWVRK